MNYPQTTLALSLAATVIILASAAALDLRRRKRGKPCQWSCLECTHTVTFYARTKREAWTRIGADIHVHGLQAHPDLIHQPRGDRGMVYSWTLPPEWANENVKDNDPKPR